MGDEGKQQVFGQMLKSMHARGSLPPASPPSATPSAAPDAKLGSQPAEGKRGKRVRRPTAAILNGAPDGAATLG